MRIDIVAAIPDLMRSPLEHSIMMRARDKGLLEVHLHDLRAYGIGKARQIDDYPYGGGAGRVMKPEPIFDCIENLQAEREYEAVICRIPAGDALPRDMVKK